MQKIVVVLLSCLLSKVCLAADLFDGTKPEPKRVFEQVDLKSLTIGGYPIPDLGVTANFGASKVITAGTVGSSTRGLEVGSSIFFLTNGSTYVGSLAVQANLEESTLLENWTSEPCKGDAFLWKSSIGGRFSDVNCATISSFGRYLLTADGNPDQVRNYLRDRRFDVPTTTLQIVFTRFSTRGRTYSLQFQLNPRFFLPPESQGALTDVNNWDKWTVERDPVKAKILGSLVAWAGDLQRNMEVAFTKNLAAYRTQAPLRKVD